MNHVYLDTCIYIYHLSDEGLLGKKAGKYFQGAEKEKHTIIASSLVLHEIMAGIYKESPSNAREVFGLLTSHPGIEWLDYDIETADLSAQLRSHTSLKTPDCIHLATAHLAECTSFITNDQQIKKYSDHFEFKISLV